MLRLRFLYRDNYNRAVYLDLISKKNIIDVEDVFNLPRPQFDLLKHRFCVSTMDGEPDYPVYEWDAATCPDRIDDIPDEKWDELTDPKFVIEYKDRWMKPFVARNYNSRMIDNGKFRVFCAGGYPCVCSIRFETYHQGGSWDLTKIAFIIDDELSWLEDADLISERDKKLIAKLFTKKNEKSIERV